MILATEWEPAPSGSVRAQPARAALVGALGSVETDLRRATTPPTPTEAGGVPDYPSRHMAGGTVGARSERRG